MLVRRVQVQYLLLYLWKQQIILCCTSTGVASVGKGKRKSSPKKKVNTSARSNRANNKRSALSLEPCRLPASGRATPGPDRVPPIHIYSTCKPPQLCARAAWLSLSDRAYSRTAGYFAAARYLRRGANTSPRLDGFTTGYNWFYCCSMTPDYL
ncbi:hypothetical protein K0M31_007590 [Melipona bicolor]|uniref:Uncharacterized protein n=1 Tax=Melipona bicolor TaxID=60889 RepID=A0AA40KVX9_9HYME|nr:hypothetical protein K0M31_007590 [Melipona bicolor]